MKIYFLAIVVSVALGSMLAGCSRPTTDQSSATPNRERVEGPGIGSRSPQSDPAKISADGTKSVMVYKSPTCGCCSKWEEHLTRAGFEVSSRPTENMTEIRKQYNVPERMQSCHTAVIDGYVIEGHVPAADVKRLLETRPEGVAGLAAPGMPPKSPGMQPEGEKPSGYDVLSFDRQGNSSVFASY